MNNKPKISIIVPVYNTGMYLEECLESILNQIYEEYELICINDASTDLHTNSILREYSFKFKCAKIIELTNRVGAGEARNIGLSYALGQYVIFLDADDIFHEEMLLRLFEKIRMEDADICIGGYRAFFVDNCKKIYYREVFPEVQSFYNSSSKDLPEDWLCRFPLSPWTKLFKRSFLIENNINFQSLSSCNDVSFSCRAMLKASKIAVYREKPLVEYRTLTGIQISSERDPMNVIKSVEHLLNNIEDIFFIQIVNLLIRNSVYELAECNNDERKRAAYIQIKRFIESNKENIQIKNVVYNYCVECYLNKDYRTEWYKEICCFDKQLELQADVLKHILKKKEKVLLWGNGKRGEAFQRFCKKNSIDLVGIIDKKNQYVGDYTKYGFEVLDIHKRIDEDETIVACNTIVFQQLIQNYEEEKIINLELFCPI